jgi:hypothetical protein
VHGLGAHRDYAWLRKKDASIQLENDVNWLKDLLPATLRARNPGVLARVFCYNYDSRWLGKDLAKRRLADIANRLLDAIDGETRKVLTLLVAYVNISTNVFNNSLPTKIDL